MLSARESLEGAALADSLGAELASIRSGEHGRRARESSTRNAAPRREQGRAWKRGLRIHGVRSPRRASAPPRSSTASALSRAPDLASRSCPLRAAEDPRFARAVASDGPGSRPVPRGSASTSGWLADAPQAGARPRTRGSTRPPTRSIRRTRAPVRIHDTDQIDRPRVAPRRRSWTRPTIPAHASTRWARSNAFTTKARVFRPGPSLSPSRRSTSSTPPPAVTMSRDHSKGTSSEFSGAERSLTAGHKPSCRQGEMRGLATGGCPVSC